ncbi:MAG: hypothetical protein ACI86L_000839, partial [Dokdonia sp.]
WEFFQKQVPLTTSFLSTYKHKNRIEYKYRKAYRPPKYPLKGNYMK